MKNHIKKLIQKIKLLTDGNSEIENIFHEALATPSNILLNCFARSIAEIPLDKLTVENRITIASRITAEIDEFISPIHTGIDNKGRGIARFDGTRLAREMKAITEDMEMYVDTKMSEEGTQQIQVRVGKAINLPKNIDEDIMKELMLGNQELGEA
tara:strand:- start:217 stop:681 length:465 start_codon:yes stop_codon:yes gene_type:complete